VVASSGAEQSLARLAGAIRRARVAANLRQHELAEQLGVTQSSVSQWERGLTDPGIGHFLEMVRLLGPSLLEVVALAAGNDHGGSGQLGADSAGQDAAAEAGAVLASAGEVPRPAREELAGLVGQGLTDEQIAARYRVRVKTVAGWRGTYRITRQYVPEVRLPRRRARG
jgi:DNA-binding XRE family transcriptional regulator